MAEAGVGRERRLAFADVMMGADDHRRLRGQPNPFAHIRLSRFVGALRVEGRKRRDAGAQHIHWMGGLDALDDLEHGRRKSARLLQFGLEALERRATRQLAMQKQEGRLLEARIYGKIMDRIAAVAKLSGLAVDGARSRALEIHILQAAINLDRLVLFAHGVWRFLTRGLRGIRTSARRWKQAFAGHDNPPAHSGAIFDKA